MRNKSPIESIQARDILKALSTRDFKSFGLQQFAYIRPMRAKDQDGQTYYAIFGADGEEITNVETLAVAKVLAKQNDLEPLVVH